MCRPAVSYYQDIYPYLIFRHHHLSSAGTDSSYKLAIKMAERQTSAVEEVKVTSEDVSEWTENLGAVILVQRARVRSLTAKPLMAETEKRKLESLESLLKDAIIAQDARYKKLRASTAARSKINEAYWNLESVKTRLREAIIDQGARVRKLKVKSEVEEAERRQESLKADWKAATGGDWSEVREEGPILLTTNRVRGREVLPELRERLKELVREKVIR